MSVKPVAWMHVSGGNVITDRNRDDMSDIGKRQYSIPLYSAPAPELAEALQKLVDANRRISGTDEFADVAGKIADEAAKLLARITPK